MGVDLRISGSKPIPFLAIMAIAACGLFVILFTYMSRPEEVMATTPQYDMPDLLARLDSQQTVDPALGRVPYERLEVARKQARRMLHQRAPISGVTWEERGPNNVGGRTRALMFDPNDPLYRKVWAGGVGGGLWYTNNITATNPVWHKVDDFWDNIAVTTIAFNPANTQEFYVGTGEGWVNQGAQRGSGIWKSMDGGATWNQLAATNPLLPGSHFLYVQKIAVKDNGTVFAATRSFTPDGGVMRSTDGGGSWVKVVSIFDPGIPRYDRAADIEVAANGDVFATLGIFNGEARVLKSNDPDNGDAGTWTDLSTNINVGNALRIELACAPSNANVLYAVAQKNTFPPHNDIAWFRKSTDGGLSWVNIAIPKLVNNATRHYTDGQAYYNLILAVHPSDPDLVIAGGIDLHRSVNGGTTWSGISDGYHLSTQPYVHVDHHAILFRPGNNGHVLFAHDGGITFSTNAGIATLSPTFSDKNNGYNVTQLYSCAMPNAVNSHYFLAGTQDNGTQRFRIPQAGSTEEAVPGDGGFCHIDQDNPMIQLASTTLNRVFRSMDGGITFDTAQASRVLDESVGLPINPSAYDSERNILYSAREADQLSRVKGIDGTLIREALTVGWGGGTISALKMSPYSDRLIVGINNGRVYRYVNPSTGQPAATRIDNPATNKIPISSTWYVSSIDLGADDNHILVTYSNYGIPSIWETTDGGQNWYNKEGQGATKLPDIPVRWAIYHPGNRNEVLVATELGVWSTNNFQPGTANSPDWGPTDNPLANTRCDMLKYRPADGLVAIATHGRGLFTTDIFVNGPVADFTCNRNLNCSGALTVQFTDASLKPNGSWAWDIDNNGVVDYTVRNPVHTYSSPGIYSVTLSVDNGHASITREDKILVMNGGPVPFTGCVFPLNSNVDNTSGIGIYRVAFGRIDHFSPPNDGNKNYSCELGTTLMVNTTYELTVCTGNNHDESVKAYIDYNNNGTFEETSEVIASFPQARGCRTLAFTTPSSGIMMNTGLRCRILSRNNEPPPTHSCETGGYGQAEDYTVFFGCQSVVTTTSGSGVGSLRAAVQCASSGDTIHLGETLAGMTIDIGTDSLLLDKNLVIMADGTDTRITGFGPTVLKIAGDVIVELMQLTVRAGIPGALAIDNCGSLKLTGAVIIEPPQQ